MALPALEILYIIEIIFYTPTLLVSLYVVKKHGVGKKAGWRFLTMVSLFRLIGAATGIAAIHKPSEGLIEASDIMQSFGLSSLLAAAIGILMRVNDTMWAKAVPPRLFGLLGLPLLAGLIVSIIGATDIFGNDPSSRSHGYTYLKAGVCLFVAVFAGVCAITGHDILRISHVENGNRRLLISIAGSLPFLAVRVAYSFICVFTEGSKWFSMYRPFSGAVIVHGVMGVLPELIVVVIYLFAGLTAPAVAAQPEAKEAQMAPTV